MITRSLLASHPMLPAKLLGSAAMALVLAGCAVGPDYTTPSIDVPSQWSKAATSDQTGTSDEKAADAASSTSAGATSPLVKNDLSQWWTRLNDPVLNSLITEAVSGNLDVATAKTKILQARANRRIAVGDLIPDVTPSGDVTRTHTGKTASSNSSGYSVNKTAFEAGVDVSWQADLFGGNRRAVEAETYAVQAAEADLRATLLTVIGDVATYYIQARGYQARRDLASSTSQTERETAALTRAKYQAGSASALDAANAQAEASSTEADVPVYNASYIEAVHQLSILLGQPPNTLRERLEETKPIPTPTLPLPVGVPADVLRLRPDIQVAERELAEYTARIGEAEADRYPSISLTGSFTTSATSSSKLAKSTSLSWSFGPTISLPLFNQGSLKAAVDLAGAERDEYFLAYRSTVLTALQEVENASSNMALQQDAAKSLSDAVTHYREAVRMSQALWQVGSSSFLDVLDAQRSLYSAEDSLLQTQVTIATNYVSLAEALGGGWEGDIPDGVKAPPPDQD